MPWGGISRLSDHLSTPHHWHEIPQYFVITGKIISLGETCLRYKRNFAYNEENFAYNEGELISDNAGRFIYVFSGVAARGK